jgi:hypothetical protein
METGQATLETLSVNLQGGPFYLDRSDAKLLCYSIGRGCELQNFEQNAEKQELDTAFRQLVGEYKY